MSEFLAEARILVRPDVTGFRAELEAALRVATVKPITVPIVPVVTTAGIATAAGTVGALDVAMKDAAASTVSVSAALEGQAAAAAQSAGANTAAAEAAAGLAVTENAAAAGANNLAASQLVQSRTTAQAERGIAAQGLALLGLRAGTLAASSGFLAGTVAVLGFAKSLQSAAQFETELNVFQVNAKATADQMERVSAAAKALGRDITLPGVTAQTAATAMTELAKAGLSVQDSMEGARGALQLATAAQIDTSQASELVANTLNAFGLQGQDAVKVADLLAGAAKSAQGEIGEFGTALGQVASVADQFGVSAGDTVTLLTQLAKAGLQGGRAGTTLRTAILGLIKPTAAAKVELEKLEKAGVQITKPNGAFDPTAFAQINEALKKYSLAQANAARATIFSQDAIKVLGRATSGGIEDFNNINRAVNEAGISLELSSARTQGLQGDIENLSNQASSFGLTIGEVAQGPTSLFIKTLADTLNNVNTTVDGLVELTRGVKNLASAAADSDPALRVVADNLGKIVTVGKFINPVTRAFALASIAAKQFGVDAQDAGKKTSALGAIADSVKKSFDDLANSLAQTFAAARAQQPADTGLGVKQIQNIIGGFDAEAVRAKIAKDNAQLLDVLQTEEAFLERQLQRDFVKNRPELKRLIEQSLLGVIGDIDAVSSKAQTAAASLKAKADRAAADAASAVRAREQALLSAQGLARDQRQNRIDQAAQTQGLKDDILQEKKLKALVLQQIAEVKARISLEGGRAAALTVLRAILTQINGQLKSLAQQQQDAQKAQRDALLQGVELDISFAQITENQAAEVNARNRAIAILNKELAAEAKAHGKTTVAYKEIRNQIAEQQKALDEITKAKQQANNALGKAEFEFLQAQQGFASNLLGNLIPGGATGGLVGGGAVQSALNPISAFADGQGRTGPTSGQAQTTNSILMGILQQLKVLNGTQATPEANWQAKQSLSSLDGIGGG